MRQYLSRAAMASALVLAFAHAAGGQAVRLSGSLSQTVQIVDNNNFRNTGTTANARTNLSFGLTSQNATNQISANSGIGLRIDNDGDISVSQPALQLRFSRQVNRALGINAALSYDRNEITYDEVQPDLSVLTLDGDRINIRGSLGMNYALNRNTDLSLTATARVLDFDPSSSALVPSETYGLSGTLNRTLTRNTSAALTAGVSFFAADNAADTESTTTSLSASVRHAATRTLNLNANLGASYVETTASGVTTDNTQLLYGFGLSKTLPDGSLTLGVNQSINPSAAGTLVVNTGFRAGWSHRVNPDNSIGISANYDIQDDVGGGNRQTFLGISPRYSRQLTRDVSASAAYTVQRDDDGDISQGVTLSVSRNFNFPL